jgi:hypothetical protein
MQKLKSISSPELFKVCQSVIKQPVYIFLILCGFFAIQGVVQCMIDLKLFKNMKKEVMTGTLCGFCFLVSLCFAQSVGGYGQAHHMFSRFLNLRIYEFFSLNFLCIVFLQGESFLLTEKDALQPFKKMKHKIS